MKNSTIILLGCIILGVCIVLGSIILGISIGNLSTQNHVLNGSLGMSCYNSYDADPENEFLAAGEVSVILGYNSIEALYQDVQNGHLQDLPYIKINGNLVFSRTAFNEWLIESTKANKKIPSK